MTAEVVGCGINYEDRRAVESLEGRCKEQEDRGWRRTLRRTGGQEFEG